MRHEMKRKNWHLSFNRNSPTSTTYGSGRRQANCYIGPLPPPKLKTKTLEKDKTFIRLTII